MLGGRVGVDIVARLEHRQDVAADFLPDFPTEGRFRGLPKSGQEILDDFFLAIRRRAHFTDDIVQVDDLVLAANAFVVELEVLVRVKLAHLLENLAGDPAVNQLVVAGDLQAGHHLVEGRVPNVALGRGHLAAGEKHHVAAGNDPVMAPLALLEDVGLEPVVAETRIAAKLTRVRLPHSLANNLRQVLGEPVAIHAVRQNGDPQADVVALVRAETAGAAFIVLHLVPMGRVVELIDLAGMNERLERKHRLRTLWNRGWLFAATN